MSDGNDTKGGDGTPATPTAAPAKVQLSDREQEILSKAWNCMKTQPEIDYARLAAATGMTNPRSASNAWGAIKKKLFVGTPPATPAKVRAAAANGEGADSEKKRKRATPKKKAVKGEGNDADIDAAAVETPVKKKRAPPKKKIVAPAADDDEETASSDAAVTEAPVADSEATLTEPMDEDTKTEAKNEDEV
ncbi:hypothetical protein ACHAQH_005712 [Verticillium albo-atrum]